ncbi:MAG TPA: hypothetical protein VGP47_11290 [Parachlamydiaceae bacterium]|nr:hypothetical protein [Parachlamydiaceae bacterium]
MNISDRFNSDYSITDMQHLADDWYNAALNNLSSNETKELYDKTDNVISYINRLEGNLYLNYITKDKYILVAEKIVTLCNAIANGFDKHDAKDTMILSRWVKEHTGVLQNSRIFNAGLKFSGAFNPLHNLFKIVNSVMATKEEYNVITQSDWSDHSNLAVVDSTSKLYIEEGFKAEIPEQFDVKSQIFSKLKLRDLLAVRTSSEENKNIVDTLLINFLNDEKIALSDLKIRTYTDLISFFGERCSELLRLNLNIFFRINPMTLEKEAIDESTIAMIVHLCPKIHSLSFSGNVKVTNELLEILKNLKFVDEIKFEKFNDAKAFKNLINIFPNLKTVTLEDNKEILDISILNNCKKIMNLHLLDCPKIERNLGLKSCPIKFLEIQKCEIESINCPSLTSLAI